MRINKKNKFISFLYLIRLNNVLISIISLFVAIYLTNNQISSIHLVISVISIFFLMAGGNIINDYYDIETDRINKPERPLIMNKYNLKFLFALSIVLLSLGALITIFIGSNTFYIALIASILLFFYSRNFKKKPVIGNLIISILSSLLFIFGALVGNNLQSGVFPAVFAFFMTFGREITKDIEDMQGDELSGMKTLPILIGKDKAFIVAVFNYIILIGLTFIPYFTGIYNKWYFLIVVFGVDILLLILLIMFYLFDDKNTKRIVNNYLKYDMIIGLIAVIMGVR